MTVDQAMQLALEHQRARRIHEADVLYTEILKVAPDHVPAMQQLGCLAFEVGRFDIAIELFQRTAAREPQVAVHKSNLGEALRATGRNEEAVAAFSQAIALDGRDAVPFKNLGLCLVLMGRLSEAEAAFEGMIVRQPTDAEGYFLKGYALLEMGEQGRAIALLRQAVKMNPELEAARSHLLIALNHEDGGDPDAVFRCYLECGTSVPLSGARLGGRDMGKDDAESGALAHAGRPAAGGLSSQPAQSGTEVPHSKKLRVGFVSADLRQHSVAYFLEPLFTHHDRSQFEFFAYAAGNRRDQVTDRFQAQVAGFCNITPMTDDQAAAQIKADRIDILVDLAGHTPGHRLGVFARKSAPIQIAWLGYPNTTGLPQMDFRITDALADPPGETERWHTERLVRLPECFLCYGKLAQLPEVAPLPAVQNGFVTFGSFGRLAKLTPRMIALWADILKQVPDARLFLKSFGLADAATCAKVAARFAAHGISADRLTLRGFRDCLHDHLVDYSEVDIALDTYPYHGTTTTCEALQMGVPVVVLAGRTHVARVGVSLLAQVGLDAWVARTEADYVDIAVARARYMAELAKLRANLRSRFLASPLADGPGFARKFEAALRRLHAGG